MGCFSSIVCTVDQKKKKKTINSNTNYCREMELIPTNMDYYLLQFNTLKFIMGDSLQELYVPNFNFFCINPQV